VKHNLTRLSCVYILEQQLAQNGLRALIRAIYLGPERVKLVVLPLNNIKLLVSSRVSFLIERYVMIPVRQSISGTLCNWIDLVDIKEV
jgi:hypothetical protein